MSERPDDKQLASLGRPRIASRQIDELIGIARALTADELVTEPEVQMLKSWLAVSHGISHEPLLRDLARRIDEILADGRADPEECGDLLSLLKGLCSPSSDGELMKSASLPLTVPAPQLAFPGRRYCFTGTFHFGQRKACEGAVAELGASAGSLTQKTDYLVVGVYATESWKHSAFGTKILRAAEWRDKGISIAIVGEEHWAAELAKQRGGGA